MLRSILRSLRGNETAPTKGKFDDRREAESYIRGLAAMTDGPNAEMIRMHEEYLAIKAARDVSRQDRSDENIAPSL